MLYRPLVFTFISVDCQSLLLSLVSSSQYSTRRSQVCRAFHSKFNCHFSSSHPNIFIFINVFKKMQVDSCLVMNGVDEPKAYHNHKFQKNKLLVGKLITAYKNGHLERAEFLKCVSRHYYGKKSSWCLVYFPKTMPYEWLNFSNYWTELLNKVISNFYINSLLLSQFRFPFLLAGTSGGAATHIIR